MAIEKIIMPQLGESVTEGTISKWLVSIGDKVNKYDPLAEVTTDKVNAEVPSSFSGVIKEILAEEGTTLAVGEAICTIEVAGVSGVSGVEAVVETNNRPAKQELEKIKKEEQPNKKRYSPAVLRISQENDIDLEQVNGTGAGGRITRKDLLQLIESGSIPKVGAIKQDVTEEIVSTITRAEIEKVKQLQPLAPPSTVPGDIEIPVTGVRKAIAANMVRSRTEIPHAWMMMEVDVTNLVEYRNSVKEGFKKKEGFNLTFFAFFVKAVAQVLKEFPQINSMWAEDKIIQKKDINISIAVAADDSLFVPVIKAADEKTVKGIAREITELAKKARSGKLVSADMQGGTFTLNNTGAFGSVQSMGIINHPQAAILQVESIVKRPVIINNAIAVRDMVNLCLSIDHRVLDGFISGLFLARVKEILENTSKETTSIY
ncbi:dihydrolipoamide acetyltransferase family protein [Metabacillus litoralis]|uniref:dihydrolipoamide acetyltransferase family protein n=1 Tax=Metabacillus litoralis TaxID=152268 RepID=UPI00203FA423|nr:dihydrolipoamide acetyltransferase family protein [Metabacillus litoralis]MCM3650318.1 2-oxo acid dehydrogenase subunit E2 [Metabacillus litoralis]